MPSTPNVAHPIPGPADELTALKIEEARQYVEAAVARDEWPQDAIVELVGGLMAKQAELDHRLQALERRHDVEPS